MNTFPATIHDPQTGKALAQISILGEPIPVERLISMRESLQSFALLSGNRELWQAWFNARALQLCSDQTQQLIRIVMYPADGEDQGYYEILQKSGERHEQPYPQTPA
jgi:hypothetical protein